jgi:N-glycosylase/DNA lyase
VQIRQIVSLLCEQFGEPCSVEPTARLDSATGRKLHFSFPTSQRIAVATESELRACKMGFRAPYLLATARAVADGKPNLERLRQMPVEAARLELMKLPGVGRKIADCVLLFAYGFQSAFPVDVWVVKALQRLYFPKRRASAKRLRHFSETYFGANAGYAQQYLFHYMRTKITLSRGTK